MITAEGATDIFDKVFRRLGSPPTLYLGVMSSVDSFDDDENTRGTDTLLSHPGWVDSGLPRVLWTPTFTQTGTFDIRYEATVTFTAETTIEAVGFFLATTKDNTGLLIAQHEIGTPVDVEIGDDLEVSFTFQINTSNGVTIEGSIAIFDRYFFGTATLNSQFYVGFKDTADGGGDNEDTLASHPSWGETESRIALDYTDAPVQHWFSKNFNINTWGQKLTLVPDAVALNPAGNADIGGWFLCDAASGSDGVLIFQDDRVANGDENIVEHIDGDLTLYPWVIIETNI
jgi:hypothetical protein